MAGFAIRKHQRLKKLVPVRYLGDGIAGEGITNDLSLSRSYMTWNAPVSVGLALALEIFVPGDPAPSLIDRATVKWVTGSEFGVDFDTPQPTVAERITTIISTLVRTQHGSFPQGISEAGRCIVPIKFGQVGSGLEFLDLDDLHGSPQREEVAKARLVSLRQPR